MYIKFFKNWQSMPFDKRGTILAYVDPRADDRARDPGHHAQTLAEFKVSSPELERFLSEHMLTNQDEPDEAVSEVFKEFQEVVRQAFLAGLTAGRGF